MVLSTVIYGAPEKCPRALEADVPLKMGRWKGALGRWKADVL
jgi:hypothetical protein